ncbi:hypothetical protein [Rhodoferax sp.]|uniref:hypothetical protein n=1 Tax=Rhodoferax sp. TaxID=50421 RepID=UPI002762B631|nr:hypothetical protein [Rhodoferax sp.]
MTHLSDPLESALRQIEQRSGAVSAKLITGEPQALADAASALQQIAVEFFQIAPSLTLSTTASAALKARLQRIAAGMAMQRENLIRRQVVVQRALDAILPAAQGSAYAKTTSPYSSVGKQTGAFKVLAA